MLVNLNTALEFTEGKKRAVAAFNVFGYEDAKAVADAADEMGFPVILMANKPALAHMPVEILGPILIAVAKDAKTNVCVHLDHCTEYSMILRSILSGFTSVMFDGSQLPFEENVERTKEIVKIAHAVGVNVEAEIGAVGYADTNSFRSEYTTSGQAVAFEKQAAPDAIAIAVGTVHRMTTQNARLNFELMDEIVERLSTPTVIHGSTGVTDEDLKRLAEHGAKKINIGTALRKQFGNTLRQQFEADPKTFDRISLYKKAMEDVKQVAKEKMALLFGE